MMGPSDVIRRAVVLAMGLAVAASAAKGQPAGRVPAKVGAVLRAIDETGRAPEGHAGGNGYRNDGRRDEAPLPRVDRDGEPIDYRTWDVNPSGPGRGRGAERLVTGTDGSAYYSPDGYASFVVVRNPARSTLAGADHAREADPPRGAKPADGAVVRLDPATAARVDPVVDHVLARGEPMPGFVGGRTFRNLGLDGGAVLPKVDARGRPIAYREWDVRKKVPGRSRGAERVVTGSDGRVYYTRDHYATFERIR